MKRASLIVAITLFVAWSVGPALAQAGIEAILGKWLAKAETPNGPVQVELDLKKEGDQLAGTATLFQGTLTMSAIKWEDPLLTFQLDAGGTQFKLQGTLKDGKFSGTWEQSGSDVKGTWAAERPVLAQVAVQPGVGVAGAWSAVAGTPQGDLSVAMEVKDEGGKLSGTLASDLGTVEMQAASFKEGKLTFDIDLGGNTYRIETTLAGDKLTGRWAPVAGGEGGPFTATRKGSALATASPPVSPTSSIEGTWSCVASSPEGELPFELNVKVEGNKVSATAGTPEGSLPVQKATFSGGTLVFEVEYMGGSYRVEVGLEGDKLKGKWSAIGGSDTGALAGQRKK